MTLQDSLGVLSHSINSFITALSSFLPQLVTALVILIVGLVVANIFVRIWSEVSKLANLEKALSGLYGYDKLIKAEKNYSATNFLGALIWWVVVFVFLFAALEVVGYHEARAVFGTFTGYLPKLITGGLFLLIGSVVAWFTKGIVSAVTSVTETAGGELISKVTWGVVLLFSLNLAVQTWGLTGDLYRLAVIGLFAALALGLGLAGKDLFSDLVKKLRDNLK